ncbi:MAG: hypothetical protein HY927_02595 [Elusimicrobia bacterium]|nr:hypothetical protein [Elusimicrobiota bacterium]
MDFLLRIATLRNLALLMAVFGCAALAHRYRRDLARKYVAWRYPPQQGANPLGNSILMELERKEKARVDALHRKAAAALEKAKGDGFVVAPLEAKAQLGASLNVPSTRASAEIILNEVMRDIPLRSQEPITAVPAPVANPTGPPTRGDGKTAGRGDAKAPPEEDR